MRLVLMAAVALSGCAPPMPTGPAGIDFGPRFAWVKEGASDVETRRQAYRCAAADSGALESVNAMAPVPFIGLAVVLAGANQALSEEQERFACMERAGFRLTDLRTGREQMRTRWAIADRP
jgi:hypothetical protein